MDIKMEYRFTDSYLLVFLQHVHAKDKKGHIDAYKLLGRPYRDMIEFVINSSIYECENFEDFMNFDPSEEKRLHGVGVAYPEKGLERMFEIANQHQRKM
ncbi:hypothetical protein [Paenibacillus chibensis]|uniref:hypothetical protein n=1 Tax=Paenibacillus chibensis TaxID=59846 RepID=UPI000FDCDDB7|nr:hypothetical protein [Paenibacillus chibensis]MEC0372320.1 hypothetical protein [Paenibacillus chibensis]